jgi:hypothetical protein
LAVSILTGALAMAANAAPLSGDFTIDGSVTVTQDAITWISNASVPDQATIAATGLTGDFAGLGNTEVTITDLSRATAPVNMFFPPQLFIDFLGNPALTALDADFIPLGVGGSANCPPTPPSAGQTCTPVVPGGSPFTFLNTAVNASSASWNVIGMTADGLSSWKGVFTAQFTTNYQDVLGNFAKNGTITNSFSAAITVTPVPEPQSLLLLGGGLMALSMAIRRKRRI